MDDWLLRRAFSNQGSHLNIGISNPNTQELTLDYKFYHLLFRESGSEWTCHKKWDRTGHALSEEVCERQRKTEFYYLLVLLYIYVLRTYLKKNLLRKRPRRHIRFPASSILLYVPLLILLLPYLYVFISCTLHISTIHPTFPFSFLCPNFYTSISSISCLLHLTPLNWTWFSLAIRNQ